MKTSTIGTTIWGSSSFGVRTMAASPIRREAMRKRGVNFEVMNFWVILPAIPNLNLSICLLLDLCSVKKVFNAGYRYPLPFPYPG